MSSKLDKGRFLPLYQGDGGVMAKRRESGMSKGELVKLLAAKWGVTQEKAEQLLGGALDVLQAALLERGRVSLVPFGVFDMRSTKARVGVDPNTLEPRDLPAVRRVGFRMSRPLRELVNR